MFGCQFEEIAVAIQCKVVVAIKVVRSFLFTWRFALLIWRGKLTRFAKLLSARLHTADR
jgi:hypothetical protein